jgi:hypothetical protein
MAKQKQKLQNVSLNCPHYLAINSENWVSPSGLGGWRGAVISVMNDHSRKYLWLLGGLVVLCSSVGVHNALRTIFTELEHVSILRQKVPVFSPYEEDFRYIPK